MKRLFVKISIKENNAVKKKIASLTKFSNYLKENRENVHENYKENVILSMIILILLILSTATAKIKNKNWFFIWYPQLNCKSAFKNWGRTYLILDKIQIVYFLIN